MNVRRKKKTEKNKKKTAGDGGCGLDDEDQD
jgi:hypothetical protein